MRRPITFVPSCPRISASCDPPAHTTNIAMAASVDHTFQPRKPTDSRAPCPALNALANHGYIPRDGRKVGLWALTSALVHVYNLSWPLALLLSTVGVVTCGRGRLPWALDLHDLCWHNRIEHDVSTVHKDASPSSEFAPSHPDRRLVDQLLAHGDGDRMRLKDFARARIERANAERKELDYTHRIIAHGESVLTLLVLGKGDPGTKDAELTIPKNQLYEWYGEERLPDEWKKPAQPVGFLRAKGLSQIFVDLIAMRDYIAKSA